MSNRMKPTLFVLLFAAFALPVLAGEVSRAAAPHRLSHALPNASDREQDGLAGPVRRVKTETAKITAKNAKPFEGPRVLLETATYDIKGNKIDNAYFLSAAGGTLTGKEVYKYDDKGNIVEMTVRNDDGSLLSRETYSYEFDAFGNWTKMITSVAVMEGGKLSFEPTEVTYRTISYFLDEATMAKMSQPAAAPAPAGSAPAASAPAPNASDVKANNVAASVVEPKAEVKNAKGEGAKMAAAPAASLDKSSVVAPMNVAAAGANKSGEAPMVQSEGEAPPVRAAARGSLKPVSGGILNGKAVSLPAPSYPEMAKRAHATGTVVVEVIIDVTGKVIAAKAVSGPTMLLAAEEMAAKQARFSPTLLSGEPVRVSGQINYNFTIK